MANLSQLFLTGYQRCLVLKEASEERTGRRCQRSESKSPSRRGTPTSKDMTRHHSDEHAKIATPLIWSVRQTDPHNDGRRERQLDQVNDTCTNNRRSPLRATKGTTAAPGTLTVTCRPAAVQNPFTGYEERCMHMATVQGVAMLSHRHEGQHQRQGSPILKIPRVLHS